MKFRAAPLVYRAVYEGLISAFQQAKQAESAETSGDAFISLTADSVMRKLNEILIFDENEENLANLQHIAEEMVSVTPTK